MSKFIFVSLLMTGCLTRAPTDYELDRRAGFAVPGSAALNDDFEKIRSSSALSKSSFMPARLPPIVEKIWVFDRKLGNQWLQGTWLWVEIERGRWLPEVDPGGANLVVPNTAEKQ